MMSPVLWGAAHPDDETLMSGVPIVEHVALGQDVHVLLLTDGETSSVLNYLNGVGVDSWWGVAHNPADEGYAPLTVEDFTAARVRETTNALNCMASGLSGTLTLHRAALPTGFTADAAQAALLAVCDEIAPGAPVRIKGHTHLVDDHPDHIAVGQALRALSSLDPVRFSDRRHYVEPGFWADPRLSQLPWWQWDAPSAGGGLSAAQVAARARNACRAYGAWAPISPLPSFAIGQQSTPSWFDTIIANPKSMVHP